MVVEYCLELDLPSGVYDGGEQVVVSPVQERFQSLKVLLLLLVCRCIFDSVWTPTLTLQANPTHLSSLLDRDLHSRTNRLPGAYDTLGNGTELFGQSTSANGSNDENDSRDL